ncbi:hypothetical protein BDP27DRAFT_1406711, partial [Rhodocollybia butyracea]
MNSQDLQLESVFLEDIVFLLSITILYYDHFLTLDKEIQFIWKRPRNSSSYLFFINRYFAFFGNIAGCISLFIPSLSSSSCQSFELYDRLFRSITQGIVTALLSLRVYALYECRRSLLIIFMSIAVLGTGASIIVAVLNPEASTQLDQGCHTLPGSQNATKTAIGWEGLFVFDLFIFGMIMRKAYQMRGFEEDVQTIRRKSLRSVIVRDGSVYFIMMALANLGNIVTFYASGSFQKGSLTTFAGCLSVTLMSRLMLNLHEAA